MPTSHEIWKDAANVRVVALNKALELHVGRTVSHLHVLDVAKEFAAFLLGTDKE